MIENCKGKELQLCDLCDDETGAAGAEDELVVWLAYNVDVDDSARYAKKMVVCECCFDTVHIEKEDKT